MRRLGLILALVLTAGSDFAFPQEPVPKTETSTSPSIPLGGNWWAWQPLVRPNPPSVDQAGWVRTPIDQFILARLKASGLSPAPPASKLVLIKRVTYDLTGLPPSPEEVAQFLADDAPDAYERLVDRLLDSPQHGVKWARQWLDLVRFAETDGYERDRRKPSAWRYRDWVVDAINRDEPWDEFLRAQLAGDELADRDLDSLLATGYYRLGIWDDEPTDVTQAQNDDLDSIIDVTSRAMLGMSISCARCHEHKRDPILQEDYYRLAAVFRDVRPYKNNPGNSIDPANFVRRVPELFGQEDTLLANVEEHLSHRAAIVGRLRTAEGLLSGAPPETAVDGLIARHRFDETPNKGHEGNGLLLGGDESGEPVRVPHVARDDFTVSFWMRTKASGRGNESDPRWFQGTGLVDGEIPGIENDLGISMIGNGMIAAGVGNPETFINSPPGFNDGQWHHVAFTRTKHTGEIALLIDGVPVASGTGGTQALDAPSDLVIGRMRPGGGPFTGLIDEVRIHDRVLPPQELLSITHDLRLDETAPADASYAADIDRLLALRPPKVKIVDVLCALSHGTTPVPTTLLVRGNHRTPGTAVAPGVPAVLGGLAFQPDPEPHHESPGLRRAFAEWLIAPDNPVSSRVAANRLWQYHFGRGIVRSSDDFGRLGNRPTHPALLDWLATELVANNWSMKAMHRLLLRSNAYRMSSRFDENAFLKDSQNDLFWRFELRRLSAEELRDSILAASGTLNLAMGGPSIYPTLPKAVLETASRPLQAWGTSSAAEQARRSLYIFSKRSLRHPFLEAFDQPDTDQPCAVRFDTTVPTQSLTMLNSGFVNVQAQAMAARLMKEVPNTIDGQLERGLELVLCRKTNPKETRGLRNLIDDLQAEDGLSEAQALEAACLLLLNLNEFMHVN